MGQIEQDVMDLEVLPTRSVRTEERRCASRESRYSCRSQKVEREVSVGARPAISVKATRRARAL